VATLDEEIRRQQIISALLEAPEAQAQSEADSKPTKPDTADQDIYGDWRKWPSIDPDKVRAGHIDLGPPPETPLTIPTPTPESPRGPVNVQTDPETGVPYVVDPDTGQKVLRAELATPADKEAFKPADVTLPERTVESVSPEAPDKLAQVERAQLVRFPGGVPATMPWRPSAPGFIEGSPNAILNPAAGVTPIVRRAEPVTYPTIAEDQPLSLPPDPQLIWQQYRDGKISRDEAIAQAVQLQEQVKRATLVQFPKGQPATMPWHPAGEKPVPGFVEGSQNAILNPATVMPTVRRAELVDPDPDAQYLDPEVRRAALAGQTPRAQPAVLPTGPKAPGTHTELAPPGQMDLRPDELPVEKPVAPSPSAQAVKPVADDWKTWTTVDGTPAEPQAVQPKAGVQADTSGGDNSGVADYFRKRGEAPITDENDPRLTTVNVGGQKWNVHKEAAPYFQGFLQELSDQGAPLRSDGGWNYRQKVGAKGLSEHSWAGAIDVNQEGRDEVTPEFRKWILDHPGALQAAEQRWHIYGGERFGDLGHFEWGGVDGGATGTDTKDVAETLDNNLGGLLKNKGAVFAEMGAKYNVDPRLIAAIAMEETGNGTSKLLATRNNIGGITGPGHDGKGGDYMPYDTLDEGIEAAARLLRKRYLDQGLTTIDQIGAEWAPPGASNDPNKTNQQWPGAVRKFYAALGGTGELGGRTAAQGPKKQDWESWATLSPTEETQVTQSKQVADTVKLNDGLNQSGNLIAYYKDLAANPPKGVNPEVVKQFQANLQKTITEEMQKRFPDMSPEVAWQKAQEDSSLWDIGAEFLHQGQASFAQLAPVFAQRSADKEQLNAFFDNVLPGGSDADKQALLAQIHALPREQQGPFIASKIPLPQAGQRGSDPMAVLTAIDHLSDPEFQKKEADKLAAARAFAEKASTEDPRLRGSVGGAIAQSGAAAEQIMAYYRIPIIGAAQAAEETRRAMAKEHPDWDEAKLDQESAYSSLAKVYGNTIAASVMGSGAGLLLKSLTTPWKRVAGQVLAGTLTNMGISGGTTIATNIAEGKPAMQGVGESALTGAVQGALFGGLHGVGELRTKPEIPLTVGLHGPPEPPMQRVTREGVLGPDVADISMPWYKPGPVVTRGTERTVFTPSELAEQAGTLTGRTPEELMAAAEGLQPPMNFIQRSVFLNSDTAQQAEILRARAAQAPQEVQGPAPQGPVGAPRPETDAERLYREKYGVKGQPSPVPGFGGVTGGEGAPEPWMSKIANRFMAERIAKGDVGPVEPGHGETTEALVARGSKMGPEQVAQHVSNLMHDVGGNSVDQAAAVRFEEARLSQRSHDLSRIADANPGNQQARIDADDALKYVTDFHNKVIAKLKNDWHKTGMTLQGDVPVDLSNYNGLREEYFKNIGKMPPSQTEPVLRNAARKVRDASVAQEVAMQNLGKEIDRQSARRPLPTHEQVREAIAKRMRGEFPCPT
jgi:hypothetical protein